MITKLVAGINSKDPRGSTGADVANTVNALIDLNEQLRLDTQSQIEEYSTFVTDEADRAEIAAQSAELNAGIYPDTTAGVASVTEGSFFSTPSPDSKEYLILYRKVSNTAVEIKRYPSSLFFTGISRNERAKAPSIYTSDFVELLGFKNDGSAVFKVSSDVLGQLDPYYASVDQVAGIAQSPLSKSPAIYTSDFVELLGFKDDGSAVFKVSPEVAAQLAQFIQVQAFDPIDSELLPNQDIVAWGDSMTVGIGGGSTNYPSTLAAELGRTVYNRGVGSQNAKQIAVRQGGVNLLVTIANNEIPASGSVAVTDKIPNILPFITSNTVRVTIAGVSGLITTDTSGNWTFTRDSAGTATSVAPNSIALITGATTFVPDIQPRRNNTCIIWAGRNGITGNGRSAIIECRDSIISMVQYLKPLSKRVLVVSVCNGRRLSGSNGSIYEPSGTSRYNDIMVINRELYETFRESYVDLRYYMVNHAIYDAGLTPTSSDLEDMAADCIPTTLMSDDVHFTAAAYIVAGKFLARQIKARGW